MRINLKKWSKCYSEFPVGDFEMFVKSFRDTYSAYASLRTTELAEVSRIYFSYWQKISELCKKFLHDNLIIVENERDVVTFLISCGVPRDGKAFYLLHNYFSGVGDKRGFIIPKKYFSKKYSAIFEELLEFFTNRILKEAEYDVVS